MAITNPPSDRVQVGIDPHEESSVCVVVPRSVVVQTCVLIHLLSSKEMADAVNSLRPNRFLNPWLSEGKVLDMFGDSAGSARRVFSAPQLIRMEEVHVAL